jgi:hypothetical protein
MADISITASDVLGDDSEHETLPAGEVIAAGDTCYKSANTWLKADADASTTDSAKSVVRGMALNSALVAGQKVKVQKKGVVTVGSVLTVGEIYVQSGGAGKICPKGDLAANDWVTVVGVGKTATQLDMKNGPVPYLVKVA